MRAFPPFDPTSPAGRFFHMALNLIDNAETSLSNGRADRSCQMATVADPLPDGLDPPLPFRHIGVRRGTMLAKEQCSARFQRPPGFGQRLRLVTHRAKREGRQHGIKTGGVERQVLGDAFLDIEIDALGLRRIAGAIQETGRPGEPASHPVTARRFCRTFRYCGRLACPSRHSGRSAS